MSFDVRNFIPSQNLDVLKRAGLHKVANAMRGDEDITLKSAIADIASQAFVKRAEAKKIAEGLNALAELRGEKVADGVWGSLLNHAAVPAMGGAALMALPEMMKDGPMNTDEVLNKALMGGAMGGLGGMAHGAYKAVNADPGLAQHLQSALTRPR